MAVDPSLASEQLEARLRTLGTAERAAGQRRYLKSDLTHLGVTVGDTRGQARSFARGHPDLTHADLVALTRALWARQVYECRLAAVLLLEAYPPLLGPDDLDLLSELIADSHTWALVDPLSINVLGRLLMRHPDAADALDTWAAGDDFWIRRAALLSQLGAVRGGSLDRFSRYAEAMLDDREFFIRKAIGWVLREAGKRDPDRVYAWLAPRIERASGVTVREAVKYLRPEQRTVLLAARGARRA